MLIIGICGGHDKDREAVTACLVDEGGYGLGAFVSGAGVVGRAVRDWRRDLERGKALKAALCDLSARHGSARGGVVVAHVMTPEEADAIRAVGGSVWHLCRPVSLVVPIRPGDLLITEQRGGVRHFLDALEALSVEVLRHERRA